VTERGIPGVFGNARTLEEFVALRGESLVRFGYVLTGGDLHLAQDLVQAALMKVMGRWPRIVAGGYPEAYVRRAIVSGYLSGRRRRSALEVVISDVPERVEGNGFTERDDYADVDARDLAWRMIVGLPKGQRAIVALRYLEGWSDEQIAAVCGCAVSTVRSQASRALGALRERLGPEWTVTVGGERGA
jgi:RNA polymerase sigma-70 factor (sigma-E family)